VAGFWRPRRQAETGEPANSGTEAGVNLAAPEELHDSELQAQLDHLEAIERRHERLYMEPGDEGAREGDPTVVPLPEEAWPQAIPPLPAVEADSVAPLQRWLETARVVLSARASRNRDELQRLGSQWVHISRNLNRFRADEVAAVVESEARVRERIAADETACHLIRLLQGHLGEWGENPVASALAPADVEMVRRLLDDAAIDRVRATQAVLGTVIESLSATALDMEVVQRQAEREPEATAEAIRGLHDRMSGLVDDLRGQPGSADLVVQGEDEPLHAALRRSLDAYQHRLAGDLTWSGGEPEASEVRAAVLWIAQEFLAGVWSAGGREVRLGLANGPDGVALHLSAEAPVAVLEAGWLLRCRARAAVAGGTLAAEPGDGSVAVDVRFPVASPA
jgi:hypothetical protein